MRSLVAALMLSALTVAWVDHAAAGGVMYSAPANDGAILCGINNAGTSPIVGTIETVFFSGNTATGPSSFMLAPGEGTTHAGALGSSCKVTLTKGSPKKVRGTARYRIGTDGVYAIPIQ